MPRSARDSDEDTESKTDIAIGRRMRMLNARAVVDSPVRRSSRIKQSAKQNKSSPESPESDTSSVSNSQTTRITRQRTATMDSTATETLRGRRTRQISISSDISEMTDVDVVGTPKKVTRRSLAASVGTPTRASSRTTRHLARAGSEGRSPPLLTRITRRTRATSVDPETMSEQSKSQPNTPVKMRRRASIVPSRSPVKEEVEEGNDVSSMLMGTALVEVDEFTSSGNTDSSPDKTPHPQKSQEINEKRKSINENKMEEESHVTSSSVLSISDEICQLSEKMNEVHSKHVVITTADKNEFFGKEGNISGKNVPPAVDTITSEPSTHNTSFSKYKKANGAETESNLAENEQPPNDTFKNSAAKEIGFKIENLLNISGEEKRKSSSNKENQIINVINETSTEKNVGPIISNVTSLSTKHLTSAFASNKSLNEKEIKSVINEASLSKRRHSRESTESTAKFSVLPKEIDITIEEKMDISIDSSSPQLSHSKTDLDGSLLDGNRRKKHSMLYDDNELTTTNNINKSVLSKDDDMELVDKITDKNKISAESINESDENAIDEISILEEIDKTEEITIKNEIFNQAISDEISHPSVNQSKIREINDDPKSSSSLDDNNEIELLLEEQDACQDEKKLRNNSSKSDADCDSDHLDMQINVVVLSPKTRNNKSVVNYEQSSVTQSDTRDNLPDSIKQSKKDSSDNLIEMSLGSSNAVLETIDSTSNDLSENNEVIQVIQSSNAAEISKEFIANMSSDKAETKDILLETTTFTKLKSTNISSLREKENVQENLENRETADNDSDVDIGNLFQDIPAAEWREKVTKKNDNIVDNPHSDSHSMEKLENESEAECDLVLVDKQAWLAAESMKVAKENQCFDYDSDDTVVLKSRLDAAQSANNKKLNAIKEDLLVDEFSDEEAKLDKPSTTRRFECAEESDSSNSANTSRNKSKIALSRSNNRAVSTLNKSKQAKKALQQSFKIYDESDESMDLDESMNSDELNRSLPSKTCNTSIRKSTGRRQSLNKSSKDTSSKQDDQNAQDTSANRSQADDPMENTDNIIPSKEQSKPKIKKAFNKSMNNEEADTIKSKKNLSSKDNSKNDESECANRSVNKISGSTNNEIEPLNRVDLESDSGEVIIPTKNFDLRKKKKKINYSTVAHVGSTSDDSNDNLSDNTDSSSISEDYIPTYFFASSNSDNSSIDSDIKRDYNLNGTKQDFDDDDVPGDECRASESEYSDPDDDGLDLANFIVDDEMEVEEKVESESDEEDEQNVKQDEAAEKEEMEDIDEDEQNAENDDDIMEKEIENVDEEQTENADEEQTENTDEEQIETVKKESNKMFIKKDAGRKKSVKTEMSTSSNITLDRSFNVYNIKDMSREHNVPFITEINKKTDVKANKSCTKENEITSDISNLTPPNKKRKSDANNGSSKDVEQSSTKQSNKTDMVFKKKLPKLYSSMECSTPKNSSFKQKFEIDAETSQIALDNQDKQSNNTKRHGSSEKKKMRKNSTSKEDVSLKEFKCTDYEEKSLMCNSLPSDLKEIVKKVGLSKPTPSKQAELHNTMNVTHTETPTIRFLRKEKLNESAPVSKLKEETNQLKKNSPDKKDITQTEVKKKKEKASGRMIPSNDDVNVQECNRRKQKKRKKHAEEKSAENIIDETVSKDMIETNIPKKKKIKHNRLDQASAVKNDACKDAYQTNEKGKKKKQIGIIEKVENANEEANVLQENIQSNKPLHSKMKKKDIEISLKGETLTTDIITKKSKRQNKVDEKLEYINEANILQKDIQTNKIQLSQYSKKKKENVETSLKRADNITKKAKRQNKAENKEAMAGNTLERKEEKGKKKEDTTTFLQTILKPKSEVDKSSQSEKLQLQNIIMSNSTKSENIAFTKARDEALEAIKRATEKIKLREKLKKKKQREDSESNIEKQDKISTKQKKKEKNVEKLPSSTCDLKRLPSDVLDNLSDGPTRAKKMRKLSRNEEKQKISLQPITSSSKFIQTKMKNRSIVSLSSCGSTTQFAVVNLENVKKQPSKIADKTISFRQRMLNKNNRQPISSYLMYLQKQRATSNTKFSNNVL